MDPIPLGGQFGPIKGLDETLKAGQTRRGEAADKVTGPSFKDVLSREIDRVNEMQLAADRAIEDLATGKAQNLAEVMTAVEKADLAFKTLMQIRNKLMEAFDELNRMRV